MDRRKSLKIIGLSSFSAGVLLDACKPGATEVKAPAPAKETEDLADRQVTEIARDKALHSETFFTPHEMSTITVLADIIIPKDEKSGSASDAKVPEFIEFIVKDMPDHQVPMRGGLRWLDLQCLKLYQQSFKDCTAAQQIQMVEKIAYPGKAMPGMKQGVAFFNRMRNLTASGFFTTKIGMDDVGYVGNKPNQWIGVPPEIIKQYGLENVKFT